MNGLITRVCQRLLALAAGIWHNWQLWEDNSLEHPLRSLIAYDH